MNDWVLTIIDTSVYAELIPVSCPTLQVQVPGFNTATMVNDQTMPTPLAPDFMRKFTACNLGLQKEDCGTRFDCLPDGIYVIKYSVSPNDIVYVEYNHLRIVKALKQWNEKLCELDTLACEPFAEKKAKRDLLIDIKADLESAVNMVEYCLKPTQGMELYNYALERLRKLDCQTC